MPTAVSARSFPGSEARRSTWSLLVLTLPLLILLSCRTVEPPTRQQALGRETLITWEITPPGGYLLDAGFVTLEYLPQIPPGGRLTVHLGYRDIRDANTVWYRFEVTEGSRSRLRLEGEEGIPNVKDHDGYWWNDLDLNLDEPIADRVDVIVTDKRIDTGYPFTVRRVVTYK